MKTRRGMIFRKSAKPLGLLAEHPERLRSTRSNTGVKYLSGDTPRRSAVTPDYGTAAASSCPHTLACPLQLQDSNGREIENR